MAVSAGLAAEERMECMGVSASPSLALRIVLDFVFGTRGSPPRRERAGDEDTWAFQWRW